MVKVFKFGGASIENPERMRNVVNVLKSVDYEKLVVVVSAMGKTTNALEKVVKAYFNDRNKAIELFDAVKQNHYAVCQTLFENPEAVIDELNNHFVEGYWLLEDQPQDSYDYCYDQIVSIGELASTTIIAALLNQNNIQSKWIDARGLIRTSDKYREGEVDWTVTRRQVDEQLLPVLADEVVVTQGFIGSTDENHTTTLGREGSDFTGAILSNCLNAETYTIWKDVPGVLNADPRKFENTAQLKELTYREAVEMTYYGAKVIHPKTIKPVQNKSIPLIVRSFIDLENQGTKVAADAEMEFPKSVIIEMQEQTFLHFYTKDFSFFEEEQIIEVMKAVKENDITINLLQRGAIQCSFIIDTDKEAVTQLMEQLEDNYNIEAENELTLLTIRHYSQLQVDEMTKGKSILLEQQSPINYQVVYKK